MKLKSPLSKQTAAVYSLLLEKGALNAEEIGKELNIFPQAVYRSVETLKSIGCVNRLNKFPARFEARPVLESVETFSLLQREWFLKVFSKTLKENGNNGTGQLNMSFIESRKIMFEQCVLNMQKAKEVNLLISGDEAPAEMILESKRMIERGGSIRALVQKRDQQNEYILQNWKRIGMQVRVGKLVNARINIYDQRIVYFMSYDPSNLYKSVGIKFEYAPLGQLMNTLFMHYWQRAKLV